MAAFGAWDYAGDRSCWLANPALGVVGSEQEVPVGSDPASPDPRADAFVVHGTLETPSEAGGNHDYRLDMPPAWAAFCLSQGAVFNNRCRVFMPMYRFSTFNGKGDPQKRHDLAYGDVAQAFEVFLAMGGDRPFFLLGHSQGGLHVLRLLDRRLRADAKARRRLAGCYAPGVAAFAREGGHFFEGKPLDWPLAAAPGRVGALAFWNCAMDACAFGDHLVGGLCAGARPATAFPSLARGRARSRGCYGWDGIGVPTLFQNIVTELVERDGLLRTVGHLDALAFYCTPQGCLHKWDLHMLWGDVRHESGLQLDAWLAARR